MSRRIELPERSRRRTRARDVRWNVQAWAAIATALAGLMSVPALIISMNALRVSEQQRADALAERREDQRTRTAERAEADVRGRAALATRIEIWQIPGNAPNWHIRNSNSNRIILILRLAAAPLIDEKGVLVRDGPMVFTTTLNACTEGSISAHFEGVAIKPPAVDQGMLEPSAPEFIARTAASNVWVNSSGVIVDWQSWAKEGQKLEHKGGIIKPVVLKSVKHDILPCA